MGLDTAAREMFDYMDADKDGKLSFPDFQQAVRSLGVVAANTDLAPFAAGDVTFEAYKKLVDKFASQQRVIVHEEYQLQVLKDLRQAFDRMDAQKRGWIHIDELRKMLTTTGDELDESEFQRGFLHHPLPVNKGNEKMVNFEQFYKICIGKSTYRLK